MMSRRSGRVARRASAVSTALTFNGLLALAAGRPFFTADNYHVDGVSGGVDQFIDWNDPAHQLVQTTAVNQVAVPANHADFGGTLCATFTAAQAYQSNRAAALWVIDHDGVSTEKWDVFTPTSNVAVINVISTTLFAGNVPGSQIYYTGGGNLTHYVGNAGGTVIGSITVGAATLNTPMYTALRHRLADTPDYELRNRGTLANSGAFSAAPTGAAASQPLTLGSNGFPGPSLGANMRWKATFFTPALSTAERAQVQQFIQREWGIAA